MASDRSAQGQTLRTKARKVIVTRDISIGLRIRTSLGKHLNAQMIAFKVSNPV